MKLLSTLPEKVTNPLILPTLSMLWKESLQVSSCYLTDVCCAPWEKAQVTGSCSRATARISVLFLVWKILNAIITNEPAFLNL